MSEPPSYPPPPPPPGDHGYPPSSGGYGYPPPAAGGYGYPQQGSVGTNSMAIASLVCSLVGWMCIIGPILGLIFGFVALGQIKQTGQDGRGMAIAGIAISGAVIGLLVLIGIAQLFISH
ncbi:hypothetical protein A9W99_17770 [Mycobacterium sp. 1164966.3]|uniref:DUF4190 domain-containing protein n=1 Tax=Mycobacterium sp. 1164966.3 TaxID=1856861 RepID=UPI0008023C97|nr:DUF4190 domain-containing protein [Mycobacterium sp. 1164966.3]OBA79967.1 hypothetical protein A9W99_17770 [Mycobacterium sp. 1164966.3]